jgi:integrase
MPWQELPAFWSRLAEVEGMGAQALRFAILTAARSGEVRGATWQELDLVEATWSIPAARMKAGRDHRVPLAPEAWAILCQVAPASERRPSALVFPGARRGKPLSDMTLSAVLRRLEVPVTVHGFRSSFRDWSEEATSFSHEGKEAALAHSVKDPVEAAYRRGDLFAKRRELMKAWGRFVTGQAPAGA